MRKALEAGADTLLTKPINFPSLGAAFARLGAARAAAGTDATSRSIAGQLRIGWSQEKLAREARVGIVTVHQLEAGVSQPRRATLDVIQRAFEAADIEFIDENGGGPEVRLRKRQTRK